MKCLITGITGFAGSHLAEYLLSRGDCEVHGTMRWRSRTENITQLGDRITTHGCDIRDATAMYELIRDLKPDRIYHLAAQSFVPMSWVAPAETMTTNVIGQINIFDGYFGIHVTFTLSDGDRFSVRAEALLECGGYRSRNEALEAGRYR